MRARRCCAANNCRCSSSIVSHSAACRSAREPDGVGVESAVDAAFVFLLLDGVDDDVDGIASSFIGLRFGIAPEGRRVSGVGACDEDAALDVDAVAGASDGAGNTATGDTTAPACLRTKSSRCWRVSDNPRSVARLTIILSKP